MLYSHYFIICEFLLCILWSFENPFQWIHETNCNEAIWLCIKCNIKFCISSKVVRAFYVFLWITSVPADILKPMHFISFIHIFENTPSKESRFNSSTKMKRKENSFLFFIIWFSFKELTGNRNENRKRNKIIKGREKKKITYKRKWIFRRRNAAV